MAFIDETNNNYGHWTVVSYAGTNKFRVALFLCRCDCLDMTEKVVPGTLLRNGSSTSCGCKLRQRNKQGINNLKHGQDLKNGETPEYRAWVQAKNRVLNPNYPKWERYGGRGITMCTLWLNSFEVFYSYLGPKPEPKNLYSLDRIDNSGNYEPGNVRWATAKEQANNRG